MFLFSQEFLGSQRPKPPQTQYLFTISLAQWPTPRHSNTEVTKENALPEITRGNEGQVHTTRGSQWL